ncbi:hypothetical protein V5P93_007323 [Actinokineospora auranticolor]|uniref:Uncharacterized protein n=1 Tax=Actinokineospora auranticolor TaxID=155976 RepID=A0A2S6GS26_9PSEU|nr:hypothetical protein [Actinokineospora auranticolor]PPK67977.1 hypothetical protein CLV40_106209 [Actinokineospora auranticolor]
MSYQGPRAGQFAVVRGVTHPCTYSPNDDRVILKTRQADNPDASLFTWHTSFGGWVAQLTSQDCDRVYAARTYGRWQGHRVAVDAVVGGIASVTYADSNGSWAGQNGFTQVDKYEYQGEVPVGELADVHEEQRDLTFNRWRDRTFGEAR